jgi:hypothetical protein
LDFSISTYKLLLKTLLKQGFSFSSLNSIPGSTQKSIFLRHDVDLHPDRALKTAFIEREMGLKGSYYFRCVPESFDEEIITQINSLGHEIGYHYEDLSLMAQRRTTNDKRQTEREIADLGIESFARNLERLRSLVPVNTICMHGSPLSRWDSRLLWKYYDYKDFGIESEPYFDVDFSEMLYLTDTGRRWNGEGVSVRDKALGDRREAEGEDLFDNWVRKPIPGSLMNMTEKSIEFQSKYNFRSTKHIIQAANRGELPNKIMMTFHPQRWTDKPLPWVKELVWQNVKNVGKYFLVRRQALGGRQ